MQNQDHIKLLGSSQRELLTDNLTRKIKGLLVKTHSQVQNQISF